MGRELVENFPTARGTLQEMDDLLRDLNDAPKWNVVGMYRAFSLLS